MQTLPSISNVCPTHLPLSLEQQLLLSLARPSIDDAVAEHIYSIVQKGIDWPTFLYQAEYHWVTMQIYPGLKRFCASSIPADLLTKIETTYFANTARNLLLARELIQLLKLLTTHGILAIPFKGPTLAISAYGHLARRKFSDLDILVAPADFQQALALLSEKANYQKLATTYSLYRHEYPLVNREAEIFVDLHQQIAGRDFFTFPLQFEEMVQRVEEMTVLNASVPCFHPEDVLLILGVHGSKHCWELLGWICDFAAFIQVHRDLDWHHLGNKAHKLGCDRMLSLGLSLSRELLGVSLPDNCFRGLPSELALSPIKSQIYQRCFAPSEQVKAELSLEKVILHVRLLSRVQDQVAYLVWCIQRLFTPTHKDMTQFPLPQGLHFLHYLLRPLRLLRSSK